MRMTTRICAAGFGVSAMVIGIGLAFGEAGTTTGQVTGNSGTLEVRTKAVDGKKTTTKMWRFQYGVDTEVTLGDEKIRGAEIAKNWNVTVTWKQDIDEKSLPKVGEGAIVKPGTVGKPVVIVNKNPMVAEKIAVVTKTQQMLFAGFDGTDKVKVTYEETSTAAVGKKASKRVRTVTANLYDKAKFFVDSEEVDKSSLNSREGQEVKADIIEDAGPFPTIYKLTFKKDAK